MMNEHSVNMFGKIILKFFSFSIDIILVKTVKTKRTNHTGGVAFVHSRPYSFGPVFIIHLASP
jgi:hypothetical protein